MNDGNRRLQESTAKLEAEEAEGKKHKVGFIPMVKGYWKTLLLGCGTRWWMEHFIISLSYGSCPIALTGLECH